MKYCVGLYFSPEEHRLLKSLEANAGKHVVIVNDIFSWDKELIASKELHKEGAMLCSSLKLMMDETEIDSEGVKRVLWQLAREFENKQESLEEGFQASTSANCDKFRRYMQELRCLMAGNEQWSKETLRYSQLS